MLAWMPGAASAPERVPRTASRGEPEQTMPVRLLFEKNLGQAPAGARYVARSGDSAWSFARHGFAVTDGDHTIRIAFEGSSGTLTGERRTPTRVTYLRGNDRREWTRRAPAFRRLRYRGLYRGVDAVFHPSGPTTEYDFELAAGVDPEAIRLQVSGGEALVDGSGALEVRSGSLVLRQERPRAFQRIGRRLSEVPVRYVAHDGRVTFRVGAFDRSRPLVIDPVISYSTFLGGSEALDVVYALEADDEGNLYVAGAAGSPDFPTTSGAFQRERRGPYDAFVAKFRPNGRPAYITFVGGSPHPGNGEGGVENASGVAVDGQGRVYFVGSSDSPDYPLKGAFDTAIGNPQNPNAPDAIVTVLSRDGSKLVYSTFLGGSQEDSAAGVAPRPDGSIWVGGSTNSADFPVVDAYQPEYARGSMFPESDGFVARIAPSGDGLTYSTYLGGSGRDHVIGLRWVRGHVYVAGKTEGNFRDPELGFPTTRAAFKKRLKDEEDSNDAFVTKFASDPSRLAYSTLLGGTWWEDVWGFDVDRRGHAYVVGETPSADFPTKHADRSVSRYRDEAFLTKFNRDGSGLVYSRFFGDWQEDWLYDVAADRRGRAHVAGKTGSHTLIQKGSFQPLLKDTYDGIVATFSPRGRLEFASYIGGRDVTAPGQVEYEELTEIAVSGGNVYVAGRTGSSYPTKRPFQKKGRGTRIVVTRLHPLRRSPRHATKVSVRLRRGVLRGRVRVPDGFVECKRRRRVVVEHKTSGDVRYWLRHWQVPMDRRGRFRLEPPYSGRYRVEVSSSVTRSGGRWHLCGATTSRAVRKRA